MSLTPGTRIGPYEIAALIGEGGMGEVYRARDTALNREVALKVLPDAFARDPDRLARFRREAQLLASLNHPNIAGIHGFEEANGVQALVLELVEGPTLADRIDQGPIPVDEALPIARQVAEALEAAHEQGIIHRDLKPANIKLRPDGTSKVLDFGLAKLADPSQGTGETRRAGPHALSQSPTITSPAMVTGVGMLLGTATYMSPEQAKGRSADKRGDIWAFGCVLFEMLTGRRAFAGEDVAETLAAVLTRTPDWSVLSAATPPAIRRLLQRCLERDHRRRLADIADARFDLEEALAVGSSHPPTSPPRRLTRMLAIGVGVLLVAMIAAMAVWLAGRRTAVPNNLMPVLRADLVLPAALAGDPGSRLSISPDGRRLAFIARDTSGRVMLWVRPLDGTNSQALSGTEGAGGPFWSPNSRSIAFTAGGKLKRIDADGGQLRPICDSETTFPGAWNRSDIILFTPRLASGLYRVNANGGTPSSATIADQSNVRHYFPTFLPDDRRFIYYSSTLNGSSPQVLIGKLDAPNEQPTLLRDDGNSPSFAGDRLLFVSGGTLFAQKLDPDALRLVGDATPVADDIEVDIPGRFGAAFSVSSNGVLVIQPNMRGRSQLTWFDRNGRAIGTIGEPVYQRRPTLSPSGSEVAVDRNRDIWVLDVANGVGRPLTADPTPETYLVWSPTGDRIVFSSRKKGRLDLYERGANEAPGAERVLLANDRDKFATAWSPDGKYLLFISVESSPDVWMLPLTGDRIPRLLITGPGIQRDAKLSSDGRWVAYSSNESGRMEVFVAPFPGPGKPQPVSSNGGDSPHWSAEGELFYLAADNYLMAVRIESVGDTPAIRGRERLFQPVTADIPSAVFDVAPDGKKVLVAAAVDNAREPLVSVLVNWTATLPQ